MEVMANVQWILKGKDIEYSGEPVRNCRFKTDDFGDKKR